MYSAKLQACQNLSGYPIPHCGKQRASLLDAALKHIPEGADRDRIIARVVKAWSERDPEAAEAWKER